MSYEELVTGLEDAWVANGMHEHTLFESVQPATLERQFRAELFPQHDEPLTEHTMPPWVDVNFTWTPLHQLRVEGHRVPAEPLDLVWTYTVFVRAELHEQRDQELVRAFRRAIGAALQRVVPDQAGALDGVAVEVRRVFQSDQQGTRLMHVQLVSTNITDLSEIWEQGEAGLLRRTLQAEVKLASAIIHALHEAFVRSDSDRGGYQSVNTA